MFALSFLTSNFNVRAQPSIGLIGRLRIFRMKNLNIYIQIVDTKLDENCQNHLPCKLQGLGQGLREVARILW